MGEMLPQELAAKKTQLPKKALPAKPKKGSVLSAIEDIQRMSPEAICQEFDRMVDYTQERHFKRDPQMPCVGVAAELQRCLQRHRQQSFQCFDAMDDYRQCVSLAAQDHVDRLAEQDELDAMAPLPVVPPQSVPKPAVIVASPAQRRRSWLKPWTWLR